MALVNIDDQDPWLYEYEACERLQRDIMEQLSTRNVERKTSDQYARLSVAIRVKIKQYNNEVGELRDKNAWAFEKKLITAEEYERRIRQIEFLYSKELHIQSMFNKFTKSEDRNKLLSNVASEVETVNWGTGDDDVPPLNISRGFPSTSNSATEDLRQQQKLMLSEQDKGLEELSKIISRQKNIAQTISNEVEIHNDIINDLVVNIENTDDRVHGETQRIVMVERKDRNCGYWTIIIILFIAIIIVEVI